jgi:hypothetical protein
MSRGSWHGVGAGIGVGGRNRARARGIRDFPPDAQARPQREVEADRWAATAHGGPPGGSGPLRRKLILNIENNFPFNIEQKIIQNK